MLLEMAVGDALGCCFEWTEKWIIKNKNNLKYLTLQENPSLIKPGNYTDDTQMALGIAELMITEKEWTPLIIAKKFVEVFHRDPRRGYAPGFWLFLQETKTGEDFCRNIRPNSERSGAAMRAGPLGLIKDINELTDKCNLQSSLTHDTPRGRSSALCVALAVHYFKYEFGTKEQLPYYLNDFFKEDFDFNKIVHLEYIPVDGWPCVLAAIASVVNSEKLSEVLKNSIDWAGDTDTIATIAMAIASQSKEITQDLPQNLVDELENGTYGREYIKELDKKLISLL